VANDIIGAPEIIVIKGRLFYFHPLTDYDEACLESWVKWRTSKDDIDTLYSELESIAGAAQILYYSCRKSELSETVISYAQFLNGDEAACQDVYLAWIKVNTYDGPKSSIEATPGDGSEKCSVSDIYVLLGRFYKWASPEVVRQMTRRQQIIYLEATVQKQPNKLSFDSEEDFMLWKRDSDV